MRNVRCLASGRLGAVAGVGGVSGLYSTSFVQMTRPPYQTSGHSSSSTTCAFQHLAKVVVHRRVVEGHRQDVVHGGAVAVNQFIVCGLISNSMGRDDGCIFRHATQAWAAKCNNSLNNQRAAARQMMRPSARATKIRPA